MTLIDLRKCVKFGGVVNLDEQEFDVENDSLPITVANDINFLLVDFFNFDADIDVSSDLPTNLCKGSRVVLRKKDNSAGRLLWSDGVIDYKFVNRAGEYLELWWTGTKFTI